MEHIIKTSDAQANAIIDNYLAYAKTQWWYFPRRLYSEFRGFRGKHDLIDHVLLPEQDYKCCYCMKHLTDHNDPDVTIEHVIRQSSNVATINRYFLKNLPGLSSQHICHSIDYVNGTSLPGQYPHRVAYHNMVMSCESCNGMNGRGHEEIDPLFFVPNIHQEVIYDRSTGEMTWLTDPEATNPVSNELPTVEKIKLNRPHYKAIRSLWLFGKDHPTTGYSTPDTITTEADKEDLILRALEDSTSSDPMTDIDAYIDLLTPHFWSEVLKYGYFATI